MLTSLCRLRSGNSLDRHYKSGIHEARRKKMLTRILVCCLVHFISVLSVDGVSLSLNPPYMVIGSSTVNPSMSLNIQCSSSGTLYAGTVLLLRLSRRKFTEPTFAGIALMNFDGLAKLDPTVPSDIQTRSPNITGSVDTGLKSATMTLSISAQGMACTDQAEFQCEMFYVDLNQIGQTVTDNRDFTVITVPSEVIIDSPEYYDVNGNTLQLNNNSVLNTGTRIKFRCTANVGSAPEGEIIWERSSEMGIMNLFIPYTPTLSTDIVQEASQQNGCFYRRISTMYYNLTKLDDDGISFRCRARTYLGGQLYDALSNQQYRAVAARANDCNSGEEPATGSDAPCRKCARGTYRTGGINGKCQPCPEGNTTNGNGSTSAADCYIIICPLGQFWDENNRKCVQCEIGFFQDVLLATSCKSCPVNYSTRLPQANNSTLCEFFCQAGYEIINGTCTPCKRGFFKDHSMLDARWELCVSCSDTNITTDMEGSTSNSSCVIPRCNAGQNVTANKTCGDCPVDTYQLLNEPNSSISCIPCPDGTRTQSKKSKYQTDCIPSTLILNRSCETGATITVLVVIGSLFQSIARTIADG